MSKTIRMAQALGSHLGQQPETHSGTSGPHNFNGLVRHYFLRRQPKQADIRVNLLLRHSRKAQRHDIARRMRPELDKIATPSGARIKVAEIPPGPPVLETLVEKKNVFQGKSYSRLHDAHGPPLGLQFAAKAKWRAVIQLT